MKTMNVQKPRQCKKQLAEEHARTATRLARMGRQENYIAALCKGDSSSLLDHNAN